jgi:DNA polymerase-3 subunit alpha
VAQSGFVHLHTHSQFSLLDGACRVRDLAAKAVASGMPALALTDHGNLFGAIDFYRTMRDHEVKPILGMEAYLTAQSRHDRGAGARGGLHHLVLLARNATGYQNLMRLATIGHLEGFYYKPRIDRESLARHAEGLIGLSSCIRGEVSTRLLAGQPEEAEQAARRYAEIFDGQFYLELQDHGLEAETRANQGLLDLARRTGLPLVATNDCHYLERAHAAAHDVLVCIQTNHTRDDPRRLRFQTDQLFVRTPEEMRELFGHVPEALANTLRIAEACDVDIPFGKLRLPRFPLPEGFASLDDYLKHLAWEGLRRRFPDPGEAVRDRLAFELETIERMGYAGYFLIVRDFIEFARGRGIPVGPGRGSAAGSLVSFAIGITNIDPIKYDLLFERFLNPERISMPDIDVDFSDRGRAEVIRYVVDRYGAENVCQIITFGTMAARAVVRDVGRVLGMTYPEVDRIAKLIPAELKMTLEKALSQVPELRELADGDPRVAELLSVAKVLEGLTRHASTHAAGVVITPTPLVEHVPLFRGKEGEVTTQFDMGACEAIGLLKMDLLGLRTLTVVQDCLTLLAARGIAVDVDALTFDDPGVFALIGRGETVGIFQFESSGMVEYLKKLRPECLEDLIAMNALYRPGPLGSGMVEAYIARKHGTEALRYEHPSLEPILKSTHGVIVYQEQVMQIASTMAGYALGDADLLRRAMAKKKKAVMRDQRRVFVDRASLRSIPPEVAERVFDLMDHFAEYGFNRSHSAGYAVLAYQTAYLKAHHPVEFMAATLSSELSDSDRLQVLLAECRRIGIRAQPPDVQASPVGFGVADGAIRFGLAAIKGLGRSAAEAIVAAREREGSFRDFAHFCECVEGGALNRRAIESLIQAGALDAVGGTRAQQMAGLPAALDRASALRRDRESGQGSLFVREGPSGAVEEAPPPLPQVEAWDPIETLRREKEALGFYLSQHPLDAYRALIRCLGPLPVATALALPDRSGVQVAGTATQVRRGATQRGEAMVSFTLEDPGARIEVLLFGATAQNCRGCLDADAPVLVGGRIAARDGRPPRVFAERMRSLPELRRGAGLALHLALCGEESDEGIVRVREALSRSAIGEAPVFLHIDPFASHGAVVQLRRDGVPLEEPLLEALIALLGEAAVRLVPADADGARSRQLFAGTAVTAAVTPAAPA